MKKVVVFDVENVLFNFKNVEKWLKGGDEKLREAMAVGGLLSHVLYLGMGDELFVDLYKWREYERMNLPVRDGSCYEGWRSAVEDIFKYAREKMSAA